MEAHSGSEGCEGWYSIVRLVKDSKLGSFLHLVSILIHYFIVNYFGLRKVE